MSDLEKAREFFKNDIYATEVTGIEITEARAGYAKCELKIERKHKNAADRVMGGVYFTMADFAFAIAANLNRPITVTQTSQIAFLSAAKGDTLYAEAEKIKAGKNTCFYKITVSDDLGTQIAYVTTTGFTTNK
jgi:acyl-CoA thioesterase